MDVNVGLQHGFPMLFDRVGMQTCRTANLRSQLHRATAALFVFAKHVAMLVAHDVL